MSPAAPVPGGGRAVRGTTVAHGGQALLIRGEAGTGKSALALELIGRGAALVADDRTVLTIREGRLCAGPPPAIAGLIEARGLGLLPLAWQEGVPLAAVVDLDTEETERLPPRRTTALLGHRLPLFRRVAGAHFPSALLLALSRPPLDPETARPAPAPFLAASASASHADPSDAAPPRHQAAPMTAPDSPEPQAPRPDEAGSGGDAPPPVLVTGPSGAGRSTAIRALEDLGFEAIDNLPLSLIPRLLDGPPRAGRLALGVDTRNRDFSTAAFLELIDGEAAPGFEVLYLDCSADMLLRRFSETRRRHPLAPAETPLAGIEREFDLLAPIRARADILIDTSELTLHELRAEIARWFGGPSERRLAVSLHSFSYKRGLPRGMDMVFDCRFLRNPYWDDALRDLDGRDPRVADYVAEDPRFDGFFSRVVGLTELLLPAYVAEGKSHLSIAFGCTGGRHRSAAVAERLAKALAGAGWRVSTRHRELERHAAGSGPAEAAIAGAGGSSRGSAG